jgi:hypothetical protein
MEPGSVITALKELVSGSRRITLGLLIASAVVLYAPERFPEWTRVSAIVKEYSIFPVVVLVVTGGLFAADCVLGAWRLLSKLIKAHWARRAQIAYLKSLTPYEKAWLYLHFIKPSTRHCERPTADQIAVVLNARGWRSLKAIRTC